MQERAFARAAGARDDLPGQNFQIHPRTGVSTPSLSYTFVKRTARKSVSRTDVPPLRHVAHSFHGLRPRHPRAGATARAVKTAKATVTATCAGVTDG